METNDTTKIDIVQIDSILRCPPCQSGSDSYLLQGLNVQTGLCNFILVHAVYLFSLEKESLTLLQGTLQFQDYSLISKPLSTYDEPF